MILKRPRKFKILFSKKTNKRKLVVKSHVNKSISNILKPHQIRGSEWMICREKKNKYRGGILADDPGLGKTYQIIELLLTKPSKTIIIVPKCILSQWEKILRQFFDSSDIQIYNDSKNISINNNISILLTTYGKCYSCKTSEHIRNTNWSRIVLDEGHVVRNQNTKVFKSIQRIIRPNTVTWIITGTPLQNSYKDIKNLIKLIGMESLDQDVDYIKRRNKQILYDSNELEEYNVINHLVPFETELEENFYKDIYANKLANLKKGTYHHFMMIELILRMRQASIDPRIVMKSYPNCSLNFDENFVSSKINSLVNDISKTKGLKLVITQFNQEMDLIYNELKKRNIKSEKYNGSMTTTERQDVLNKFPSQSINFDKLKLINCPYVLLLQIKAGGVGLNLQQFSNIFILSPDWNPSNEHQAISRIHRIGQKYKISVHKYTLTSPNFKTIDQNILDTQKKKRSIMADVLDDQSLLFNEIFKMKHL